MPNRENGDKGSVNIFYRSAMLKRAAFFIAMFFLSVVVLSIVGTEFSYGFASLFTILWGLLGTCGFGLIILGVIFRKKYWIVLGCAAFLLVYCAEQISSPILKRLGKSVELESEIVIEALENHFVETGEYPKELKELTPTYLAEVPRAHVGLFVSLPYHYYLGEGAYVLGFDRPAFFNRTYVGLEKKWFTRD